MNPSQKGKFMKYKLSILKKSKDCTIIMNTLMETHLLLFIDLYL